MSTTQTVVFVLKRFQVQPTYPPSLFRHLKIHLHALLLFRCPTTFLLHGISNGHRSKKTSENLCKTCQLVSNHLFIAPNVISVINPFRQQLCHTPTLCTSRHLKECRRLCFGSVCYNIVVKWIFQWLLSNSIT